MKTKNNLFALCALLFVSPLTADEQPSMPGPAKPNAEHEWILQFVGEWNWKTEFYMVPGQPPMKSEGTETITNVGSFWVTGILKSEMMGMPFEGRGTYGYDTHKEKYVGTWVDTMGPNLWSNEGTRDGNILTLTCTNYCPMRGKLCDFKDQIELSEDGKTRTYTSSIKGDDGSWTLIMKGVATRK